MFFRLTSAFLLLLSSSSANELSAPHFVQDGLTLETVQEFHSWMNLYDKVYDSVEERKERLSTWVANHRRIEEHNEGDHTYTLGHNEYSDMTQEEFTKHFGLGAHSTVSDKLEMEHKTDTERALMEMNKLELPDFVDWRYLGGVTPIKNQGSCGSCWAFSTTGALEGARFIKTGELVALSEQNLLDCDHTDLACNGGIMDDAFKFDEHSGGLCSEEDYPYVAAKGTCNTDCTDVPGSQVKTFMDVPPGDEKALLSALAMQPISVAIQADQFVFQFYKNGVLTDDSCGKAGNLDHGVLAVGYGTDLDTQEPYFLVKNSWGESWGDEGYVKLGRNTKNKYGICAILKMASFPVVE